MRTIDFPEAHDPIVLAIDIGSSSVRALLYDADGDQISSSESQHPYSQHITDDGGSESDASRIFALVVRCVDEVVDRANQRNATIAGVAMTSYWHGLLGLDGDGIPATPVYMWSDKRSGPEATRLAAGLDPVEVHQRTGCRLHSSYWPAKLRWLEARDVDVYSSIQSWVSITDYVHLRLFGSLVTSVSMASGTGLLNAATLTWDGALIAHLGLPAGALPPLVDRDQANRGLEPEFAARWPALADVQWFPAIGDGAAANVGAGCVGDAAIAMTIGTSAAMRLIVPHEVGQPAGEIPHRIWSYRLDRCYRVLGGALSNGGNVTAWLAQQVLGQGFDFLTAAAAALGPDDHGLTMLPFVAGERSPSWNDAATGAILGLRLATTPGDIFRAGLEATAYRMAAIYDDVKVLASPEHEIHANGGAALSSPLWLQIIADTLGHRLDAVDAEAEASARGAALCALESLGAIEDLATIRSGISASYEPDQGSHQRYAVARQRQRNFEEAVTSLQSHT
jgi:gluconokinase